MKASLQPESQLGIPLLACGELIGVQELTDRSFKGVDIAVFSAGGATSETFAPIAARDGCVVIDNSSAWRMDPQVPLVVPEVKPHAVAQYKQKGIIANPNCSTIQMVVALNPIHRAFGIRRVVVSTYQSVSGTGKKAIDELFNQTRAMINFLSVERPVYPHRIAFNCLPHIDKFLDNGYTKEEMKILSPRHPIAVSPSSPVALKAVFQWPNCFPLRPPMRLLWQASESGPQSVMG